MPSAQPLGAALPVTSEQSRSWAEEGRPSPPGRPHRLNLRREHMQAEGLETTKAGSAERKQL